MSKMSSSPLEAYSILNTQNQILNGFDPQFDTTSIIGNDQKNFPNLQAEQKNKYVYERQFTEDCVAQQMLLHSALWHRIVPVFKTESQEAFHFFTTQSQNNVCDAQGLEIGMKVCNWKSALKYHGPQEIKNYLLPLFASNNKPYLNFQEFTKMIIDFTESETTDSNCQFCFKQTKALLLELYNYSKGSDQYLTSEQFANSNRQNLGCAEENQVCTREIRMKTLSTPSNQICLWSDALFQKVYKKSWVDSNEFENLMIDALYEIVFLSPFEFENKDSYFSGHILPEQSTGTQTTVNLLRNHPQSEQVIQAHQPTYLNTGNQIDQFSVPEGANKRFMRKHKQTRRKY